MKHKKELALKKRQEMEDLKKKEDALKALELRFKSEAAVFKKELEASRKSQERKERKSNRSNSGKRKLTDNSNYFSG